MKSQQLASPGLPACAGTPRPCAPTCGSSRTRPRTEVAEEDLRPSCRRASPSQPCPSCRACPCPCPWSPCRPCPCRRRGR
eukprot:13831733-Alexandrium_andersonii.AAC.1